MSTRSLLLLAALMAGCSLFKFNIDTPAKRREAEEARNREAEAARVQAEEQRKLAVQRDAAAQKARDEQAKTDIEALRAEINAPCAAGSSACTRDLGADGAKALRFAALVAGAQSSPMARDGRLDIPALQTEALGYLEQALVSPSRPVFDALAALPSTPASDAAVLRACPKLRPTVAAADVPDFVELCLGRAGGDSKQLKWPNVKADLVAMRKADEARARAEAEAARAQADADKVAAAAEKAAEKSGNSNQARAIAAVFAAGRCNFGNCIKDGWTANTDAGEVRVACNFGNCLKDGWTARLPDGSEARTSCNFGDCMKDGWETRYADGSSARTSCNFSNCPKDGWQTQLPGGGSARTSCNFGDCFKDGWTTQMPSGEVRCRCNFSKCLTDGTSCD